MHTVVGAALLIGGAAAIGRGVFMLPNADLNTLTAAIVLIVIGVVAAGIGAAVLF